MITLWNTVHDVFGRLDIWLEPVEVSKPQSHTLTVKNYSVYRRNPMPITFGKSDHMS